MRDTHYECPSSQKLSLLPHSLEMSSAGQGIQELEEHIPIEVGAYKPIGGETGSFSPSQDSAG